LRTVRGATPTRWRMGRTTPSDWPTSAASRWSGVTSALLRSRASPTAAWKASWVLIVHRLGSNAIAMASGHLLVVATAIVNIESAIDNSGSGGCIPAGRKAFDSLVPLDAQRVEGEGEHGVVADQHGDLDELALVVPLPEPSPGVVADDRVPIELVGGLQEGGVEGVPPRRRRPVDHPVDLVAQARVACDSHVLAPLVLAAVVPRRAQDEQLAIPVGQRACQQQGSTERGPAAEQLGVADERGEDVGLGSDRADAVEQGTSRLVAIGRGEPRDPRGV